MQVILALWGGVALPFVSGDGGTLWCDCGEVLSLPSTGLSCLAENEEGEMVPEFWLEEKLL